MRHSYIPIHINWIMNARTHININRLKSSVPLLNSCAIETTCTKFQNKVKKNQGDQSRKFWCDDDDVDDRWRMLIVKWSDRVLFSKFNILRIMILSTLLNCTAAIKATSVVFDEQWLDRNKKTSYMNTS